MGCERESDRPYERVVVREKFQRGWLWVVL